MVIHGENGDVLTGNDENVIETEWDLTIMQCLFSNGKINENISQVIWKNTSSRRM